MNAHAPDIEPAASGPSAHPGMGAVPHEAGTAFRVWAPNATGVAVVGAFDGWSEAGRPLVSERNGYWSADVAEAAPGQEYLFRIEGPGIEGGAATRIDPYARQVTNSVGNAVIVDPASFDWEDDAFEMPAREELVIYEMHLGTFNRPDGAEVGGFADAVARFDHLSALGVNAIQVMPAAEFAGDLSWGYNPAHIFAVESAYGGPDAFKAFVRTAHAAGFAVILDVVYNHFGPSDLDLWRFDGWSEGEGGGVYFYQDHRAATPWGKTRPDYGQPEVRQFILDNAMMWLEDYHVDGLRFDMTLYIRQITGDEGDEADALPEGWSLMAWLNDEIAARRPGALTIAEDLRDLEAMTAPTAEGGAGFGAQWDARFVHPVRAALTAADDADRSMQAVADALLASDGGDPFRRVVYTESHDEVANGKARVPNEVDAADQEGWAAQKRASLGAALTLTAAGVPMLFQGQELLVGDWFDDAVPLDWDRAERFGGTVRVWSDLIALRRGAAGLRASGTEVVHLCEDGKTLAYLRGTGADAVLVAINLRAEPAEDLRIGLPEGGDWHLRMNTDAAHYGDGFADHPAGDLTAEEAAGEDQPFRGTLSIGAYSALIFTRPGAG